MDLFRVAFGWILHDHELQALHFAQPLFEEDSGGDVGKEVLVVHGLGEDDVVVRGRVKEGGSGEVEEYYMSGG